MSTEDEPHESARADPEPAINLPLIVAAAIVACVCIHLVRIYALTVDQDIGLLVRTAFIPLRYTGGFDTDFYAFSSPVTYSFLHGDFAHLAINMIWLAAFGAPLANRLGPLRFAAFWVAASIAAAALHFVLHPMDDSPLIGASGAISGMMGAAARFAFRVDRSQRVPMFSGQLLPVSLVLRLRGVLIFLGVWMAINIATGLYGFGSGADRIAWEAHIGGFLLGFLGVSLFDRKPAEPDKTPAPEA